MLSIKPKAVYAMAALIVSLVFAADAVAKEAAPQEEKIAVVNGVVITRADFDRAVQTLERKAKRPGRHNKNPDPAAIKKEALDNLINLELLYQEGKKAGVEVSDEELNHHFDTLKNRFPTEESFNTWMEKTNLSEEVIRYHMRRGMVVKNFTQQKLMESIEVPEKEVKAYYEAHKKAYRQPEEIRASHILIKVDPKSEDAVKTEARERAEAVKKRIDNGEDFAALAKELSEGPSREKGGDLGYFKRGQMVKPFEKAAFAMKPGEVSDVVTTRFGFHIIKVIDKKPAGQLAYEEVKSQIELMLKQRKLSTKVDDFLEKKKKEANITIYIKTE